MSLEELKPLIRKGEIGMIPGWKGYIKWDYSKDQVQFVNNDYIMDQKELEDKLKNRNDLLYII